MAIITYYWMNPQARNGTGASGSPYYRVFSTTAQSTTRGENPAWPEFAVSTSVAGQSIESVGGEYGVPPASGGPTFSSDTTSPKPSGLVVSNNGTTYAWNAARSESAVGGGVMPAGTWTVNAISSKPDTRKGQTGRIKVAVYKAKADGSSAVLIGTGQSGILATDANYVAAISVSGSQTTFASDDYVWVARAYKVEAVGSTAGDAHVSLYSDASYVFMTTPDFAAYQVLTDSVAATGSGAVTAVDVVPTVYSDSLDLVLPDHASFGNVQVLTHPRQFVAVATNSAVAARSAGSGWQEGALPVSSSWFSIVYGNGVYVAASGTGDIAWSSDGATWHAASLPVAGGNWKAAFGRGRFVAVDYNSDAVLWSADGATWYQATLPSASGWSVLTCVAGCFVAIGVGRAVARSEDGGEHWSSASLPVAVPTDCTWQSIAAGGGRLLALGFSVGFRAVYSDDAGASWTYYAPPFPTTVNALAYGGGVFVAVPASAAAYHSVNGVDWVAATSPPPNAPWQCVACGLGGEFVALASGGATRGAYSLDGGATWVTESIGARVWTAIAYAPLVYENAAGLAGVGSVGAVDEFTPAPALTDSVAVVASGDLAAADTVEATSTVELAGAMVVEAPDTLVPFEVATLYDAVAAPGAGALSAADSLTAYSPTTLTDSVGAAGEGAVAAADSFTAYSPGTATDSAPQVGAGTVTAADAFVAAGTFGREYFVSPAGSDSNDGLGAEADHAFQTLAKAKAVVAAYIASPGLPVGGIAVTIRAGTYYQQTSSLTFAAADSGTATKPVVWRAYPGEEVIISGGVPLTGWAPVTEADPRWSQIHAPATLYKASTNFGAEYGYGWTLPAEASAVAELFFDKRPMQLGRWPKPNPANAPAGMGSVASTTATTLVSATALPARSWNVPASSTEATTPAYYNRPWLYCNSNGYVDWLLRVDGVDHATNTFTLASDPRPVTTAVARWYVTNLLEEVSDPGEYWIDRFSGDVYFRPPDDQDPDVSGKEVVISRWQSELFKLGATSSYIRLEGLTFEHGQHCLLLVDGSNHEVVDCHFRNGESAVHVSGSYHLLAGCEVENTGTRGVFLEGLPWPTDEGPADHVTIEDCDFHHIARWLHNGEAALAVGGAAGAGDAGHVVCYCRFHDMPWSGIFLFGTGTYIHHNEFFRVCNEGCDEGAIYSGTSAATTDVVIEHNFFHDLPRPPDPWSSTYAIVAVYIDDDTNVTSARWTVHGNVFWRIGTVGTTTGSRGIGIENKGPSTTITGNLFARVDWPLYDDLGAGAGAYTDNQAFDYSTGKGLTNTGDDTGNLNQLLDPFFADEAAGDLSNQADGDILLASTTDEIPFVATAGWRNGAPLAGEGALSAQDSALALDATATAGTGAVAAADSFTPYAGVTLTDALAATGSGVVAAEDSVQSYQPQAVSDLAEVTGTGALSGEDQLAALVGAALGSTSAPLAAVDAATAVDDSAMAGSSTTTAADSFTGFGGTTVTDLVAASGTGALAAADDFTAYSPATVEDQGALSGTGALAVADDFTSYSPATVEDDLASAGAGALAAADLLVPYGTTSIQDSLAASGGSALAAADAVLAASAADAVGEGIASVGDAVVLATAADAAGQSTVAAGDRVALSEVAAASGAGVTAAVDVLSPYGVTVLQDSTGATGTGALAADDSVTAYSPVTATDSAEVAGSGAVAAVDSLEGYAPTTTEDVAAATGVGDLGAADVLTPYSAGTLSDLLAIAGSGVVGAQDAVAAPEALAAVGQGQVAADDLVLRQGQDAAPLTGAGVLAAEDSLVPYSASTVEDTLAIACSSAATFLDSLAQYEPRTLQDAAPTVGQGAVSAGDAVVPYGGGALQDQVAVGGSSAVAAADAVALAEGGPVAGQGQVAALTTALAHAEVEGAGQGLLAAADALVPYGGVVLRDSLPAVGAGTVAVEAGPAWYGDQAPAAGVGAVSVGCACQFFAACAQAGSGALAPTSVFVIFRGEQFLEVARWLGVGAFTGVVPRRTVYPDHGKKVVLDHDEAGEQVEVGRSAVVVVHSRRPT